MRTQVGLPEAIAVLTAWTEASPGVPQKELYWEVLGDSILGTAEEHVRLTNGLAKLAGILLVRASIATGESEQEILQQVASKFGT